VPTREKWVSARRALPALLALACVLAPLGCGDKRQPAEPDPDPPPPTDAFVFTYTPPAGAPAVTSVAVAGTFNGWSETATPMTKLPSGSWRALVRQAEGPHEYKFVINGMWPGDMCRDTQWGDPARQYWIDTAAVGCVPDGYGGENAVADIALPGASTPAIRHDPQQPADLSAAGGRISVRFRAAKGKVQSATLRAGATTVPAALQLEYRFQEVWRGSLPAGTTSYTIVVQSAGGSSELGPFTVPSALFSAVDWVSGSVGYQIFPERFWNGDPANDSMTVKTDEYVYLDPSLRGATPYISRWNDPIGPQHCCHQYFGGDLQGIVDRLDYLQSLGVTLVYMNPIFLAGSAHGYDTWDYLQVDPAFGDEAVLRTLVDQAHARGMRVMWDFVPNHMGVGSAQFRDAIERGTASPYWTWFNFLAPAGQIQAGDARDYATWAGFGSLPKLNTGNAAVREHLMGAVRKWTEFGLDGIRVDVPNELADRTNFFRTFRQVAKGIDPDVFLVGEIWQRAPEWLQGDQFDALMNYAIGQDVVERFTKGEMTGPVALAAMAQLYAEYPEASSAMAFNVISTHDNSRLLTKLGGGSLGASPSATALARQRLASAMLYALPGVPVTFQGDECAFLGAAGNSRDEHRYPLQWERCDQAMRAHYEQLAGLRRDHAALRSPVIRFHAASGTTLSWFRGESDAEEVLVVFNSGAAAASVTLPAGTWRDATSGQGVTGTSDVPAYGWRYLRRG
jgi:cyclomaltodextrinase / maltogenic alpha-amylase / neopullulanase